MTENIKELESELKWYENNPFYLSKDGMTNPLLILGFPIAILNHNFQKWRLKRHILFIKNNKKEV